MPNLLTILRVAFIPVIVLAFEKEMAMLGFFLYTLAAATDIFDGYLARKTNKISEFGIIADPFADKIFTLSILGYLAIKNNIAGTIFFAFLAREIFVSYIRIKGIKNGYIISPTDTSKTKTFLEMVVLGFIIFLDMVNKGDKRLANVMLLVVLFLSLITAVGYYKSMRLRISEGYLHRAEEKGKRIVV